MQLPLDAYGGDDLAPILALPGIRPVSECPPNDRRYWLVVVDRGGHERAIGEDGIGHIHDARRYDLTWAFNDAADTLHDVTDPAAWHVVGWSWCADCHTEGSNRVVGYFPELRDLDDIWRIREMLVECNPGDEHFEQDFPRRVEPPHDSLEGYAPFVITTHGDGPKAYMVAGWDQMVEAVVEEHFHEPSEEEVASITKILGDLDNWHLDHKGRPFHWEAQYEDGSVSVTRLTRSD